MRHEEETARIAAVTKSGSRPQGVSGFGRPGRHWVHYHVAPDGYILFYLSVLPHAAIIGMAVAMSKVPEAEEMTDNRCQIAISYAHRYERPGDIAYMKQVCRELQGLGFRIFDYGNQDESEWADFLGRNLKRNFHDLFAAAECILVFISWAYMHAKQDREMLQLGQDVVFSPASLIGGSIMPVVFAKSAVAPATGKHGCFHVQERNQQSARVLAKAVRKGYAQREEATPDKSLLAQAHFHYLHGDMRTAAACLEKSIGSGKDLPAAYFNLGICKAKLCNLHEGDGLARQPDDREVEKVAQCYEKAMAFPDFPRIHIAAACFYLGNCRAKCQLYREAVECYEKAIETHPDFSGAYNNMGSVKLKLGERAVDDDEKRNYFQAGLADMDKAISLQPRFARAYYNRGRAKLCLGLPYAEAEKDWKAIEELGLRI